MTEAYSAEFIICPYCGYLHEFEGRDSEIFFTEGQHIFGCRNINCFREFKVNTETTFAYGTEELEE